MKKIKYFLLLIALLFVLVACEEIEVNPEVRSPEIELQNEGDLNQLFEETEELDDITFTLVLKYFQDNNLTIEDLAIKWFEGSTLVAENTLTHLIEIKHTLNLNVKVTVTFTLKGLVKTLTEEAVISVTERPTQVSIVNDSDPSVHQINATFGVDSGVISYTATLRNNLSHNEATWVIERKDGSMNIIEVIETKVVLSEKMTVINGEGTLELEVDFNDYGVGNYTIYLRVGKYQSSYQHYIYNFGEFLLNIEGDEVQVDDFSSRVISFGSVSPILGTGIYKWFLNGEELTDLENDMILLHDNLSTGGFLYHVEFHPDSEQFPAQISESVLIVNAIPVGTIAELQNALLITGDTGAVILSNDLLISHTIEIKKPFTIIGDGHIIYSDGIERLVDVLEADNVYFKDLVLSQSNKYNLRYYLSKNGYVEDVTFIKPGMTGGMTDLSAAIYVHSSEVTVKNIIIQEASNTGVRIDSPQGDSNRAPAKLIILGSIQTEDNILLPIASGNSLRSDVSVSAVGYVAFVIPLGVDEDGQEQAIIRWSDESEAISWILNDPNKTDYLVNEVLDVYGITIDIKLPGMNFNGNLSFVYMFLDMFAQHGTVEILNLEFEVLKTYYIIDHNNANKYKDLDYAFGQDKLLFASDAAGENLVRPTLDLTPGEYLIRITVGGEMNLGNFKITVS